MGLLDRIKLWVWLHGRALAWIAVIGVAFILAGGGFYVWKKYGESKHAPVVADASRPDVGEVLKMREAGQYDYAIQLIGDGLGRNPENRELAALRADFMEDLKVDFRLHYLRGQRLPEKTGAGSELAVSPADTYYYSVNPTASCYLYLFQINSSGEVLRLFPNRKYSQASNPVQPGKHRVPDGSGWLHVRAVPGTEQVFMVAARWEIPALDRLSGEIDAETDPARRRQLQSLFLKRLSIEEGSTDKLPGLVYGTTQFTNTGSPGSAGTVAGD